MISVFFRSFIVVFLFFSIVHSGIFYSSEIFTTQEFSYGIKEKGIIYFLSSWHRFKKPSWIARFPDGGQPKTVYFELSLFGFNRNSKKLVKHALVTKTKPKGLNIKGSRYKIHGKFIYIAYRCSNNVNSSTKNQCFLRFNPKDNSLEKLKQEEIITFEKDLFRNYWNLNRDLLVPISKLKKELQPVLKESWSFPDYQTVGGE